MNIPTEADWRTEPWGLDLDWAYKKFHGKTVEEAVKLFEESATTCHEDFLYMPNQVFAYYLKAYIIYVMSDAAREDSDDGSSFIGLIEFKAEHERDAIVPLWSEIEPVLRWLVERQDEAERGDGFDAYGVTTYSSFRTRIHRIVQRGFPVSFETAIPEIVPESTTLERMVYLTGSVSLVVAAQIFHNSGIHGIAATSQKPDILRVFGPPDDEGGGDLPPYGRIPDWIRFDHPQSVIRFQFVGDSIETVTFMPPRNPIGESFHNRLIREAMGPLHAFLFEVPPNKKEREADRDSKDKDVS